MVLLLHQEGRECSVFDDHSAAFNEVVNIFTMKVVMLPCTFTETHFSNAHISVQYLSRVIPEANLFTLT